MKTFYTSLLITFSVCTLYAQNMMTPDKTSHIFSWDGKQGTEAYQTASMEASETNHFIPVWTGNGLDQMNINVVLATLGGVDLEPGDEIALFDDNLCVGMSKLTVVIDIQHILLVKASRDDGSGNGYISGHTIVYKFWDASAGKEIDVITPWYYSDNPAWSASGEFEANGTAFVELTGNSYVSQSIDLTSGWNIFSVYLTPDSSDMKALFKPLIDEGSLVKVQDETGNSLEDYGIFGGWTNNIGDISLTEGYKAKVSKNCQLILHGLPAILPLEIPLSSGWNIMGYPRQSEDDGMTLVQPLIDRNTLVKVQDETGNSIEDYGLFGGWTNNIGHFKPGEGYKVKVISGETLIIPEESPALIPVVTTAPPDSVTNQSAWLGGEVVRDNGLAVTERGVCYGTTQTPTTAGNKVAMGSGMGIFSGKVTGLTAGTTYYVRAFATNSAGTAYGEQVSFTTATSGNPTGTFTDSRDGKTYKWVKIGDQVWMAENLAWLPAVSPPATESYTSPHYYVYGYEGTDAPAAKATANYSSYGVLYNWPAAMDGAASSNENPGGVQGACPDGWHLPGDAEWTVLTNYLVDNGYGYGGSGDDLAKSLAAQTNWSAYNIAGTPGNDPGSNDSSGFSGLPGGYRNGSGYVDELTERGYWWSSTAFTTNYSFYRNLSYYDTHLRRDAFDWDFGFSIRCIRDILTVPSVTTASPDSITMGSVWLGGEVTKDGGSAVTERGICYGTAHSPTTAGNKVAMGSGKGTFREKITGLTINTIYYARAYAINNAGTAYGGEVGFTTTISVNPTGTFTDSRDGKTYKWVKTGNQVWMAENLAWLPAVSPPATGSLALKHYYVYNYSGTDVSEAKATANYTTYGVLYNWQAAVDGAPGSDANPGGVQGACPDGWHLPGDAEWKQLEICLGMPETEADNSGLRGTDQGTQMKTTDGWSGNGNGTNTSGFSALPGGYRTGTGSFESILTNGVWWTARDYGPTYAWDRVLSNSYANVYRNYYFSEGGMSIRCVQNSEMALSVTTSQPDSITSGSVWLGGEVTHDGGSSVVERGICYGLSASPTTGGNKVVMGSGTGVFKGKITGLSASTTYYARAYAINSGGTAYGGQVIFTTTSSVNPSGTFTDPRDGKTYQWVQIGDQTWMAQNLAWLPSVSPPSEGSPTVPHYYVYDYAGSDTGEAKATPNYSTYGVLYNWPAATGGSSGSNLNPSGVRGACPTGWHLPGDAEWKQLELHLGMDPERIDATGWRGTDEGTRMKTTSGWADNGDGTNSTGFSAFPGGIFNTNGFFYALGQDGVWWSAEAQMTDYAWYRTLRNTYANVYRNYEYKRNGFSVRCVKDTN